MIQYDSDRNIQCGYEGVLCLNRMYNDFVVLKPNWQDKEGLFCDCLPSCEAIDIQIVSQETYRY